MVQWHKVSTFVLMLVLMTFHCRVAVTLDDNIDDEKTHSAVHHPSSILEDIITHGGKVHWRRTASEVEKKKRRHIDNNRERQHSERKWSDGRQIPKKKNSDNQNHSSDLQAMWHLHDISIDLGSIQFASPTCHEESSQRERKGKVEPRQVLFFVGQNFSRTSDNFPLQLFAVDATVGTPLWAFSFDIDEYFQPNASVIVASSYRNREVICLDACHGQLLWTMSIPNTHSHTSSFTDVLSFLSFDFVTESILVGISRGVPRADQRKFSESGFVSTEEVQSISLSAYSLSDGGKMLWKKPQIFNATKSQSILFDSGIMFFPSESQPLLKDSFFFAISHTNSSMDFWDLSLHCIDRYTGQLQWEKFKVLHDIVTIASVYNDPWLVGGNKFFMIYDNLEVFSVITEAEIIVGNNTIPTMEIKETWSHVIPRMSASAYLESTSNASVNKGHDATFLVTYRQLPQMKYVLQSLDAHTGKRYNQFEGPFYSQVFAGSAMLYGEYLPYTPAQAKNLTMLSVFRGTLMPNYVRTFSRNLPGFGKSDVILEGFWLWLDASDGVPSALYFTNANVLGRLNLLLS